MGFGKKREPNKQDKKVKPVVDPYKKALEDLANSPSTK